MTQELTTRQTILNKLKELNNQFPNLTRKVWREESGYTDIVYEKEFGSFLAFKQAAEIDQSPTEKKILSATARHAKTDVLDRINEEKAGYAEKFLRPNSSRFQTILTGSDIHDKLCDPFYRRLFIDTSSRVQPEKIVLAGDVFDLYEFSKYSKDPRKCDIVGSIQWVHTFLSDLRNAAPNSELILISGNHECVSADTLVLTKDGWVEAKDISTDHLVASYPLNGKALSFDKPVAIATPFSSPLIELKGHNNRELVSDTHRIDIDGELSPVKGYLGQSINQTRFRPGLDIISDGAPLSDDEIRLITWVVCDGTIVHRSENNKRIQFKLSKERKLSDLSDLLDRMGLKYTYRKATLSVHNKLQPYYITLYGNEARYISGLLPDGKQLPQSFRTLNSSQLDTLLATIQITDGNIHFNHMKWNTTNYSDILVVEEACIRNGVKTKYNVVTNPGGFVSANKKTQYHMSLYVNGLFDRNYVTITEAGEGLVVPIQTINGTLITKREGIVNFTGNCRLLRYLSENAPSLLPVLSDLHGMTVSSLLGLDRFEVNYISRDTLGVFTETEVKKEVSKNYYIAHDAFLFHHFPVAKEYGIAGLNGHHHSYKSDTLYSVQKGPYTWTQLGGGHVRAAEYCEGAKWTNGFALIHIDTYTKHTQTEYFDCTNGHCIIGGKWYTRTSEEIIVAS